MADFKSFSAQPASSRCLSHERYREVPNLGIGIGFRSVHFEEILSSPKTIDWFEIISENFLTGSPASAYELERILERYPVVMHGVSLSIGSPDPLDFDYLKKLKKLARKTKTPWVSDHLSWGKLKNAHFHDLLPIPLRKDVLDYIAERARIVQDFLEIPFALENLSSYASFKTDEMNEWEFYAGVVEKADIFMMLDVNNIYVSSRNQGFNPEDFYSRIPLDKVLQIHLAGHRDYNAYCLDTHDHPVCDAVWDIYGEVIQKTGPVSTLLEWDDSFISFQDTCNEALKAKTLYEKSKAPF